MKRINNIFYFLPALLFVIAFTSCSKDSDDVSGSELVQTLQKNKWILKTAELNEYGDSELELRRDYYAIYFTSDNEGFTLTTTKIIDTEGTDGYNRDFSHFTYTVSGNSVRLTYSGSGTMSLTYSGGNLVNGDLVYVPYKLDSSDLAVIEEGKYAGDDDFEYSIGFEDDFPYYRTYYSDGEYHYIIPMSFGVPKNTKKRGITSFGIALYCTNGTINNSVKQYTGDAYVYSEHVHGESTKCFSGTINSNDSHEWVTTVSVSSKSKSIKLKYDVVMTTRDGKTITGDHFQEQTFNYSDGNSDGNSDDNGDDDDSGSQGGSAFSLCPNNNHPHWIDLGLPSGTKWRCCNEGASSPEAYGGYFTFGQVSTAPTRNQIKELVENSTYQWTTVNGVNGVKFTGPNGGTIFLPAAGYRFDGELYYAGSYGYYWSSTLYESDPDYAYHLHFYSGYAYWNGRNRDYGLSVRPVR